MKSAVVYDINTHSTSINLYDSQSDHILDTWYFRGDISRALNNRIHHAKSMNIPIPGVLDDIINSAEYIGHRKFRIIPGNQIHAGITIKIESVDINSTNRFVLNYWMAYFLEVVFDQIRHGSCQLCDFSEAFKNYIQKHSLSRDFVWMIERKGLSKYVNTDHQTNIFSINSKEYSNPPDTIQMFDTEYNAIIHENEKITHTEALREQYSRTSPHIYKQHNHGQIIDIPTKKISDTPLQELKRRFKKSSFSDNRFRNR